MASFVVNRLSEILSLESFLSSGFIWGNFIFKIYTTIMKVFSSHSSFTNENTKT